MSWDVKPLILRCLKIIHRVEDTILVTMLLGMIFMAVLQILFRNLLSGGMVWGDGLVRIMVLWVGLLGAMIATRQKNHIRIDIVSRFLPDKIASFLSIFLDCFSALVCLILAWYGTGFIISEMEYGGAAFGKVPVWICEAIVPIAFWVMGLRFSLYAMENLFGLYHGFARK